MRRAPLTVLLVVLLAGCAGQPAPHPEAPAAVERPGWTTFESACGFKLQHPPTWQVVGSDALGLFVVSTGHGAGGVSIVALPSGAIQDLDARETFAVGSVHGRIVGSEAATLLGHDAERFTIAVEGSGERLVAHAVEIDGAGLLVSMREEATDDERSVFASLAPNGAVAPACRGMASAEPSGLPENGADAPWARHESPMGWTMAHPADWRAVSLSSRGEALLLVTPEGAGDFAESLTVIVRPNPGGVTLEGFVEPYVEALEAKYADFTLQETLYGEKLGASAVRLTSWETHIGGERWFARVVVVRPDWIVIFEGEFVEAFGEHFETMSQAVDTFRFDEAEAM